MPLNSLGGSTLQCGTWLWDNMTLNAPKRSPYWNSISGFRSRHVILHQSAKFYPNRTTTADIWRHVDFQGGESGFWGSNLCQKSSPCNIPYSAGPLRPWLLSFFRETLSTHIRCTISGGCRRPHTTGYSDVEWRILQIPITSCCCWCCRCPLYTNVARDVTVARATDDVDEWIHTSRLDRRSTDATCDTDVGLH